MAIGIAKPFSSYSTTSRQAFWFTLLQLGKVRDESVLRVCMLVCTKQGSSVSALSWVLQMSRKSILRWNNKTYYCAVDPDWLHVNHV